jgi:hypothetical protein
MVKNSAVFIIASIFFLSVSTSSCYYDKEEILYPQSVCDTTNVTFSASVTSILTANCNNTSCHGGNATVSGIKLGTYADVKIVVGNGKLVGALTHATGFSPMPKNAAKLSNCNIATIKKWIAAGALNN